MSCPPECFLLRKERGCICQKSKFTNVAAHTACFGNSLCFARNSFFSCLAVCCAVDIARRSFLLTSWSASPAVCPTGEILSECIRWDYLIQKHMEKTSLSSIFQTRSLSFSRRERLSVPLPLYYLTLHSSSGTARLSKDALVLEQSLALSEGQEHKSGPHPWKRAEWPSAPAAPKAKCSNWGLVQQHLWKDVNLQPLLALSLVKAEAKK